MRLDQDKELYMPTQHLSVTDTAESLNLNVEIPWSTLNILKSTITIQ